MNTRTLERWARERRFDPDTAMKIRSAAMTEAELLQDRLMHNPGTAKLGLEGIIDFVDPSGTSVLSDDNRYRADLCPGVHYEFGAGQDVDGTWYFDHDLTATRERHPFLEEVRDFMGHVLQLTPRDETDEYEPNLISTLWSGTNTNGYETLEHHGAYFAITSWYLQKALSGQPQE